MSRFSGTKGRRNRNSVFQLPDPRGHEEAACGGVPQANALELDDMKLAIQASSLAIALAAAIALWQLALLGRYQVSSTGNVAWRIDTKTGDVSACVGGATGSPLCHPWYSQPYAFSK